MFMYNSSVDQGGRKGKKIGAEKIAAVLFN